MEEMKGIQAKLDSSDFRVRISGLEDLVKLADSQPGGLTGMVRLCCVLCQLPCVLGVDSKIAALQTCPLLVLVFLSLLSPDARGVGHRVSELERRQHQSRCRWLVLWPARLGGAAGVPSVWCPPLPRPVFPSCTWLPLGGSWPR